MTKKLIILTIPCRSVLRILLTWILVFFSFSFSCKAQFTNIYDYATLHELKHDSSDSEVGLSYNTFIASNTIRSSFVKALLQNKLLSRSIRQNNPITSENFIGSEDNACFWFAHLPDSLFGYEKLGYRISIENSFHADTKFSSDLYKLAFFGNKEMAGKAADFTKNYLTYMKYQQVKFGLFKQTGRSDEPFTVYFGLGFVKGQSFYAAETDTATLFTEESGDYIDLNFHAKYFSSDTASSKWNNFNGFGGCADLGFIYEDKKNNFIVNCSINDVGYVWWNKKSLIVPIDTFIHWDGIMADSILWGHDTSYQSGFNQDSLKKIVLTRAKKSSFVKVIPEKVNISFTKKFFNKSLHTTLGLAYLYHANCPLPLIYARGEYLFNNKIISSLQLAYGGYDKFQCGIGIEATFSKYFKFQLATGNLLGFLIPEKSFVQSASGRLIVHF